VVGIIRKLLVAKFGEVPQRDLDSAAGRMNQQKVMITSNPLDHEGGVVQFCNLLLRNWQSSKIGLVHQEIGSGSSFYYNRVVRYVRYPFRYLKNVIQMRRRLRQDPSIKVLHVNPSLTLFMLIRDGILMFIARRNNRRTILFIHGWKEHVYNKFKTSPLSLYVFKIILRQCDEIVVLAERFREALMQLDIPPVRINVLTTMFDPSEIIKYSQRPEGSPARLLYLGRVAEIKGCGDLIDATTRLQKRKIPFTLTVAGHSDRKGFLKYCQQLVEDRGIRESVSFTGYLAGPEKWRACAEHDIFVFPSWMEGCPTAVLEALGAGLFAVCTDVGALKEIIHEDGTEGNGRFVRVRDVEDLSEKLAWAIENLDAISCRRDDVQSDAIQKFEVCAVVSKMEKIYKRLLDL